MIYLDNGATTRPLPNPYRSGNTWLNSHSSYSNGDMMLWECRERIAKCIGGKPNEIFFTSCGSEGNTWCINILYEMLGRKVRVSPNEHKSILKNPRVIVGHNELDSCMLVNNETGVRYNCNSIHKDLVQALGKVDIDVKELGCKMGSFSGHKIHGEKGVGCVWIRHSLKCYKI
jgi:cysteine desulfurase